MWFVKGVSSNSKKMVSDGDGDRGTNLDVAVVGGHSDSGFKGEGISFLLGLPVRLCWLVIVVSGVSSCCNGL